MYSGLKVNAYKVAKSSRDSVHIIITILTFILYYCCYSFIQSLCTYSSFHVLLLLVFLLIIPIIIIIILIIVINAFIQL